MWSQAVKSGNNFFEKLSGVVGPKCNECRICFLKRQGFQLNVTDLQMLVPLCCLRGAIKVQVEIHFGDK